MNTYEIPQAIQQIEQTIEFFGGKKLTEGAATIWRNYIKDYEFADVEAALTAAISTLHFAPKPADLTELINAARARRIDREHMQKKHLTLNEVVDNSAFSQRDGIRQMMKLINTRPAADPSKWIRNLLWRYLHREEEEAWEMSQTRTLIDVGAINPDGNMTGRFMPESPRSEAEIEDECTRLAAQAGIHQWLVSAQKKNPDTATSSTGSYYGRSPQRSQADDPYGNSLDDFPC